MRSPSRTPVRSADSIHPQAIRSALPLLAALSAYHRYKAVGLEAFPRKSRVIVATNHSLATYDFALLNYEIWRKTGRIPRAMSDHLFFKIPCLGQMITALGSVDGTPSNMRTLLEGNEVVAVAPGGMRESLRPSSERYQIIWRRRRGFVNISIETGAPIVLAACPKADDLYEVYPSPLTQWAYNRFKLPLPFARGLGLSLWPRPVTLTHYVCRPLYPPQIAPDDPKFETLRNQFHHRVVQRMEKLMGDALTARTPEDVALDHRGDGR